MKWHFDPVTTHYLSYYLPRVSLPTFHAPVVDGGVSDKCDCVDTDPLPECHLLRHVMTLHLTLHLYVEDLQSLAGCRNVKGMFLYSTVSSLLDRSKHFTPWQNCSFRHQLGFSGKHSSHAAITLRRLIHPHFHHCLYSQILIYTAEWTGASMERTKMHKLQNGSKGGSNPGSLSRLRVRHSMLFLAFYHSNSRPRIVSQL